MMSEGNRANHEQRSIPTLSLMYVLSLSSIPIGRAWPRSANRERQLARRVTSAASYIGGVGWIRFMDDVSCVRATPGHDASEHPPSGRLGLKHCLGSWDMKASPGKFTWVANHSKYCISDAPNTIYPNMITFFKRDLEPLEKPVLDFHASGR